MSIALTVFNTQVDVNLEGVSNDEYPSDSRDAKINDALERYNKDRPAEDIIDLTGSGDKYYEISTAKFTEWVEGFSRIVTIEYPAPTIASNESPKFLESEDWCDDYRDAAKRYLYLPNHSPGSGETMRITYMYPRLFVAGDIDMPEQDFYAVCNLSAGLCCQSLAAKYGQSIKPTMALDVVNYAQKSDFYARRAEEFIDLYKEHMGIEDDGPPAAGVVAELDVGTPYIFHGRRTR